MAVTIRDVAAAAGVSTATVSRALHADTGVAALTRNRVHAAAARLAYRPSPAATRLRTRRHGTVAVVAPSVLSGSTPDVLAGAVSMLSQRGVDCALHLVGSPERDLRTCLHDLEGRVDAALLLCDWPAGDHQPTATPLVIVGDAPAWATRVGLDNKLASDLVTRHLDLVGYRRVAALVDATPSGARVADSLRVAATRLGRRVPLLRRFPRDRSQPGRAERATVALLTSSSPPDALMCTTERLLRAAHRAVLEHRLSPGKDVGLVGYGTADIAVELAVTTLIEPHRELGGRAARALLELIGTRTGEDPEPILQPQLILGASTVRTRRGTSSP